jgi:hypothetical protein
VIFLGGKNKCRASAIASATTCLLRQRKRRRGGKAQWRFLVVLYTFPVLFFVGVRARFFIFQKTMLIFGFIFIPYLFDHFDDSCYTAGCAFLRVIEKFTASHSSGPRGTAADEPP